MRPFETRLQQAVSQLVAAQAQLVDLVAEASDTAVWQGVGIRSLAHYLTWQAGLSSRSARQLIAVAEARSTHPVTTARLAEGRATLDQTVVAVTAPADTDAQVATLVPYATVSQLRTIVRAAGKPAAAAKPAAPADAEPAESFHQQVNDDGSMVGEFRLEPDHAEDRSVRQIGPSEARFDGQLIAFSSCNAGVAQLSVEMGRLGPDLTDRTQPRPLDRRHRDPRLAAPTPDL